MPIIKRQKDDDIYFTYDQTIDWVTYWRCWDIHTRTACSTLWNYKLTIWDVRWLVAETKARGYENKWYSTKEWMKLINELRNKRFPTMPIKCWEWEFWSPKMRVHLNLWKPVGIWIKTWPKYWKDREDGILSEMKYVSNDVASSHAIVLKFFNDTKKFYLIETAEDQRRYEVTRQYLESVQWLLAKDRWAIKSRILFFDKA